MRRTHGEEALVLAVLAGLIACTDSVGRAVAPAASPDVAASGSGGQAEERAALTKIARLVAIALDNEPARQHLKRDLRAAPFREHKVELAPYLRSSDGKALLTRMIQLNGGDENALFTTLSAIRSLELYMPVAAQRETWTGKADVLVVSQLEESAPIVGFNEAGSEVALDKIG